MYCRSIGEPVYTEGGGGWFAPDEGGPKKISLCFLGKKCNYIIIIIFISKHHHLISALDYEI